MAGAAMRQAPDAGAGATGPGAAPATDCPAHPVTRAAPVAAGDGIAVLRVVVPPGGSAALPPCGRDARVLVAANGALTVEGAALAPLEAAVLARATDRATTAAGHPVLAYLLACAPDTTLLAIGSRVRGTHHARSDLDLLAIPREGARRDVALGRVSLTVAPRRAFLDQARAGAPFAASVLGCHRHLAGPAAVLERARAQFGRAPALPEPAHLADLVRFCLGRPALEGGRMLALARLRWALRTLLVLDGEDPFAAPAALAPATRALLDRLAAVHRGVPGALPELARAAAARIAPLARLAEDAAPAAARAHFAATGNLLGLEVVEAIDLHRARTRRAAPAGAV